MSEQSKRDAELRQIVTDALVSMVSGVTGLVPPTGAGQIPDFIQAPIDRAVEKIGASLPVGVPELTEADPVPDDYGNQATGYRAGWNDCRIAAAPTVKAEQVPTPEFVWVRLLEALHGDNGGAFTASTDDYREAKPALVQLIAAGFFRDDADRLDGDIWMVASGEQGEAAAMFASCSDAYAALSDVLSRVFDRPDEAPSLPAAGSAGEEVEVVAWQDADNPMYTTAERRVMLDWVNNDYPITPLMTVAQHERIVAALFAQQSAQDDEYPPCDYCGAVPDYHPWHGSGALNSAENPHIHACNECRHLLPSAQGVSVPRELLEDLRDCANECYNDARYRGTSGLDNYERLTEEADALLNGGEA